MTKISLASLPALDPATQKFLQYFDLNCDGMLDVEDLPFDWTGDGQVDTTDYDYFVKEIRGEVKAPFQTTRCHAEFRRHYNEEHEFGGPTCDRKKISQSRTFPFGQFSYQKFLHAKRFLTRAVFTERALPLLQQVGIIQPPSTISSRRAKEQEAIIRGIVEALDVAEAEYFFISIFPILLEQKLVTRLEDLALTTGSPLLRILTLFRNKELLDLDATMVRRMITTPEDLAKLEQVLAYFPPGSHRVFKKGPRPYPKEGIIHGSNALFSEGALEALAQVVRREPLPNRLECKIQLFRLMAEQMVKGGVSEDDIYFSYLLLGDREIPDTVRKQLANEVIQTFHTAPEPGALPYLFARRWWLSSTDATNREIRQRFVEVLLDTLAKQSQETIRAATCMEALLNDGIETTSPRVDGIPTPPKFVDKALTLMENTTIQRRLSEMAPTLPPILQGCLFAELLEQTERSVRTGAVTWDTAQQERAEHFFADRGIVPDTTEARWKARWQALGPFVAREYFREAGVEKTADLFERHYGDRIIVECNPMDFDDMRWHLRQLEKRATFYRRLQLLPDTLTILEGSTAKQFYQNYKGSLGALSPELTYEFAQFVKEGYAPYLEQLQQIDRAFGNVAFSGPDAFTYLKAIDPSVIPVLCGELAPFITASSAGTIDSLYYISRLAARPAETRQRITGTLIPALQREKIFERLHPSDLPAIMALDDLLAQQQHSLDPALAETIRRENGTAMLNLNDLLFYTWYRQTVGPLDRATLIAQLQAFGLPDVHRTDSSYQDLYRTSYGRWELFSTIDLAKMHCFITRYLNNPTHRQTLATCLQFNQEIGYAPTYLEKIDVQPYFFTHPFADLLYAVEYQKPFAHDAIDAVSLASIHTHPIPGYEGPSAELACAGIACIPTGDLANAEQAHRDGIVLSFTGTSGKEFAVHFYDTQGNVICLGIYSAH